MDIAVYPPGTYFPKIGGHDAEPGGERIERLNRLIGVLMNSGINTNMIRELYDDKGVLVVSWLRYPSNHEARTVSDAWGLLEAAADWVRHEEVE